ncbi:MAG: outer membrane beta-barrel protein [Candidatus Eisenbacteria bacterium]|uniref:Outer membrane beta-barrel protein n=1 Tax=Eiseniibacteriota bacterium TaxID=2212470 RepID=A0A933SD39_UNCEI|nr:outer membrane beta-barrel protein [Candidatus Eisenbacteria bacterium]
MRKVLFALALLFALMALLPATAESQANGPDIPRQGQVALGVTGGMAQPLGQLGRAIALEGSSAASGLNLDRGISGRAYADYHVTQRFALGGFVCAARSYMKDVSVTRESGTRTYERLLEGRTTQLGLYAKYFLPQRGAWSSYVLGGAAHVDRKTQLAPEVALLYPGTSVFEVRDDRLGFVGGLGSDYAWNDRLSLGVVALLDYSGPLAHDFPWMGEGHDVNDWSFLTLQAGVSWHLGVGM